MTLHFSRTHRALAASVGMATITALAILPGTASAMPAGGAATKAAPAAASPSLSYVVNLRKGYGHADRVRRAIEAAGGTVVQSYDRIGVIVVHSADPGFATAMRAVRGVESAGATRTAPLPAQTTTDVGTPKTLSAEEVRAATAGARPARTRWSRSSGT